MPKTNGQFKVMFEGKVIGHGVISRFDEERDTIRGMGGDVIAAGLVHTTMTLNMGKVNKKALFKAMGIVTSKLLKVKKRKRSRAFRAGATGRVGE